MHPEEILESLNQGDNYELSISKDLSKISIFELGNNVKKLCAIEDHLGTEYTKRITEFLENSGLEDFYVASIKMAAYDAQDLPLEFEISRRPSKKEQNTDEEADSSTRVLSLLKRIFPEGEFKNETSHIVCYVYNIEEILDKTSTPSELPTNEIAEQVQKTV